MKVNWVSFFFLSLAAILSGLLLAHLSQTGATVPVALTEYLPPPRPSEPCDLCEPNNSFDQACGPLAPGESCQYYIRCTAELDDDFYYIDLETPGTFTVSLTHIPAGTDYSVYVYDRNRQLLEQCSSDKRGNDDEYATCYLSQLGRYYIRVYPWEGCNDSVPYRLSVGYPTPAPTPVPTSTPTPPCNLHIDDFGDTDPCNDLPYNDLCKPSGWELDPPGCGTLDVNYTGSELQLHYDLTSPGECTARYTTTLSLSAYPYELLAFEIKGNDKEELVNTVIGLSDGEGHKMGIKVGDFLNQVLTDTWQGVGLPLAAFATTVDTTQLDTLFVEFADTQGASQGTIYLDSLRLERPLVPLSVDNFNDRTDTNALGGGTGIYGSPDATLETAYIADGTYDNSPGSYVISYTLPSGEWALWETYLLGLDVSDYAFLSFYIKGANGGEKVNLYLADGDDRAAYVDVEDYAPIAIDWTPVRVPLQAFEGVALTDLTKVKFVFEWEPMTSTISLDDLRFVADTLLIDNFCDSDENNSLNGETGTFASAPPVPPCTAAVTSTMSDGALRLDYDVSAGPDCYSGYWSRTLLDLNPYGTLAVKVRGERCGQVACISARTVPVATDKLRLSDYLLDGITDQWQEARIPLAASSVVTDWTRGDSYVIAFEAQKAPKGTTWWDDVAFETDCAPLWVDNFNDEDNFNALRGSSSVFGWEAGITSTFSIIQAYGDAGAGLVLSYTVPVDRFAGWETDLRQVDLSDYNRLVFNIKGATGDETFHIYLNDADGKRGFVKIENYANLSTEWQTIVIRLQSFCNLDLTRIQALQFVIEYERSGVEGTLFLDNIHFLPSPGCSQVTQNQVLLPLMVKNYTPLFLDPVWDFESGTEGWTTYKTITTSRATVDVVTSTFRSRWGNASLVMILNLVGGDDRFDRGVAYVDLPQTDLACKPLSCWVYVPTCGLGDPAEPTFARLFVKDVNDKDEYGTLAPVQRNQWYKIELLPSTLEPPDGWMEPDFDPHTIIRFGVQVRTDSQETIYRGKVYVDACGWQEIDPASTAGAEACLPDEDPKQLPDPLFHFVK